MAGFSLRSTNKLIIVATTITLLVPLFVFIFNISLIYREPFLNLKVSLSQGFTEATGKQLVIEKIDFSPISGLILQNVRIYDERQVSEFFAEKVIAKVNTLDLIKACGLKIKILIFIRPVFYVPPQSLIATIFQNKSGSRFSGLSLNDDFVVKFKDGEIISARDLPGEKASKVNFNLSVKLFGKSKIYSQGVIDLSKYDFKEYPAGSLLFYGSKKYLRYKLKLSRDAKSLFLELLQVNFDRFKIITKGNIINYETGPTANLTLTLKKVVLRDGLPIAKSLLLKSMENLILHVRATEEEASWSIKFDSLKASLINLPVDLNINNLNCDIHQTKEALEISNARCFLNDIPIGANAKIVYLDNPYIEIKVTSHPGQIVSLRRHNPINLKFSFSGYRYEDLIKGDLLFAAERLLSEVPRKTTYATFKIDNIIFKMPKKDPGAAGGYVLLDLSSDSLGYKGNIPWGNAKFDFTAAKVILYLSEDKLKFDRIGLSGYGGVVEGCGTVSLNGSRACHSFNIELDAIDMDRLRKVVPLDFDISGSLHGNINIDSESIPYLEAKLSISNGNIKNVAMLDSIADFLGISSIKDVKFGRIRSDLLFFTAGNEIYIKDANLSGKDVYLKSSFKTDNGGKIAGDILIRLPADVLKESFKMKYILSLAEEKLSYADFEFVITGDAKYPRIRWLDSKFKQLLSEAISKTDKKTIEDEVERAIEPFFNNS